MQGFFFLRGRICGKRTVGAILNADAAGKSILLRINSAASACGVRWEGVFPQMRPEDAAEGGERWPRRHPERRAGLVCRKCGLGDAVDDGDGGRVGTWSEVGGCFAANAAGRMRLWGMLSMTGLADASARGGACGAVFPQMRPEDAAEGGGRWTRRHVE